MDPTPVTPGFAIAMAAFLMAALALLLSMTALSRTINIHEKAPSEEDNKT